MCEILTKESSLIFIQSNYQTNKVNHLLITTVWSILSVQH